MIVTHTPVSHPEGHSLNHERLHHGCLTLGRGQPGDRPFYCRFHHTGLFISNLTPDAHWQEMPHTRLVRVYALDVGDALRTVNYHYGSTIDRSHPVEIEDREPVRVFSDHMSTVVEWLTL